LSGFITISKKVMGECNCAFPCFNGQPTQVLTVMLLHAARSYAKRPVDTIRSVFTLTPTTLRRRCWLALFAMLAAVLLPTLSHAVHAAKGDSIWVEVCTAQGARFVALGEDPGSDRFSDQNSSNAKKHSESCPYCGSSPAMGLPPAAAGATWVPHVSALEPPLFLHAAHTLFAWRTAQPRGPPSFS
jgi:hypothetical protein